MKKFVLKLYPRNYWGVADLEQYEENGVLVETISINKFYKVTEEWFYIYDTTGGSGIGFKPGEIIRKVYIGDAEFETVTTQ